MENEVEIPIPAPLTHRQKIANAASLSVWMESNIYQENE